jgi:hypothetical protein
MVHVAVDIHHFAVLGSVTVYEVHNQGGWYNFGFLLGAATIFGGA